MAGRGQEQRLEEGRVGRSGEQEGVWVESLVQIMDLLLIHSTNGTSDLLGAYHL